jgi:hypothetical protein
MGEVRKEEQNNWIRRECARRILLKAAYTVEHQDITQAGATALQTQIHGYDDGGVGVGGGGAGAVVEVAVVKLFRFIQCKRKTP